MNTEGLLTATYNTFVALAQPPEPVMVYAIVAVPDETPDTTPVVKLTVATEVFDDDHEPPVCVEVNVVVPFEQIA